MTTLREALQTIAVLHDGDRPCDCEGHEMARAVALAPSEREQAQERVIAAARLLRDEIAAYQSKPYYSHRYAMLCDAIDTLDQKETVA